MSDPPLPQEIITALGALCQEQRQKPAYIFTIIPHLFTLVLTIQKTTVCTTYEVLNIPALPNPIYLHTSTIPL